MTRFQALPTVLLWLCGEHVSYDDQIEFSCCCKEWYVQLLKGHFRKLRIQAEKYLYDKELEDLITDPANQLELYANKSLSLPDGSMLLKECNFLLYRLQCNVQQLVKFAHCTDYLQVKELSLHIDKRQKASMGSLDLEVIDSLHMITGLESLALQTINLFDFRLSSFPFLPTVKKLLLSGIIIDDAYEVLASYGKVLQHLTLDQCTISDVRMLGCIPTLKLHYCERLVDISPLNHNEEVEILACEQVRDYSCSFAESKRIKVRLAFGRGNHCFDLSKWKRVEDLELEEDESYSSSIEIQGEHQLPKTVKRCHLDGKFVSLIDFTVTSSHLLKEITLSANSSLVSLGGYGFEQVRVIRCMGLKELQTLHGLGSGKNRKIVLKCCNRLIDFSPLAHTPIVEIKSCQGFSDLHQVRYVRDLTLCPTNEFKCIKESLSFEHLHSLYLLNQHGVTIHVDGLEKIPNLQLALNGAEVLEQLLETGRPLENQRIVLTDLIAEQDIIFQEMKSHYDCYRIRQYTWVWIRKKNNSTNDEHELP